MVEQFIAIISITLKFEQKIHYFAKNWADGTFMFVPILQILEVLVWIFITNFLSANYKIVNQLLSCEDFEHWTHRKNSYISGYPGQYYGFDNLHDAQVKCLEIEGCVGVTKETTNKFTLRASDHFVYRYLIIYKRFLLNNEIANLKILWKSRDHGKFSFDGEESWLKPAHACSETPDKDCTDFNEWKSQARVSLSIKGYNFSK